MLKQFGLEEFKKLIRASRENYLVFFEKYKEVCGLKPDLLKIGVE